jgi:hypothetical protein
MGRRTAQRASVGNLDPLKELKGLNTLTLELERSGVDNLDALKELKNLSTLTLDLNDNTHISNLDSLATTVLRLATPGDDRIRVVLKMWSDCLYACDNFPTASIAIGALLSRAKSKNLPRACAQHIASTISPGLRPAS